MSFKQTKIGEIPENWEVRDSDDSYCSYLFNH